MNQPVKNPLPSTLAPKALVLFVLPLPLVAVLLAALVESDLSRMVLSALALGLFCAAGIIMRKGLAEEIAFASRRHAINAPAPLKLLASVLAGVGTFVTSALLADNSLLGAAGHALGALGGSLLLYGLDPRPSRGEKLDAAVAGVLADAEQMILDIDRANQGINCPELTERLERITGKAHAVLDVLETRPRAVGDARRFLTTYLEGTHRGVRGYANTPQQAQNRVLTENFRTVLETIESVFEQQHKRLMEDEVLDLDVQIEVLKTQIEREGVA